MGIPILRIKNSEGNFEAVPAIQGEQGVRGSKWYTGTQITGVDTTGAIFPNSGINDALVGDLYFNTDSCNIYDCITGGIASVAVWKYYRTIKGTNAGFGTPIATIDDSTGTPSVEITSNGPDTAKIFTFAFHNLKGEVGPGIIIKGTVANTVDLPSAAQQGDMYNVGQQAPFNIYMYDIVNGISEWRDLGKLQGPTGKGIASVVLNDNYTLTFTYTDKTTYTTSSIRGATGATGPAGATPIITGTKSGKTTTIKVDNVVVATINDGNDGINGTNGVDGSDGQDGISVTGAAINDSGHLILTLSNNSTIDTGIAKGTNGTDATINGVSTLTIAAGDGLSGTQNGSTYTLVLDMDNYDGGSF